MNYIKEFVTGKDKTLIVCKTISAVQEMFNVLEFNWFDSDGHSIKRQLRENGDCSFSFYNGKCDGFAHISWFRRVQPIYLEHQLVLTGMPTFIEVDDEF
jgi:hypothetical protein